jgi:hypothetical protein
MKTDFDGRTKEKTKPFYLSNFWFSKLHDYIYSDSKKLILQHNDCKLYHIISDYPFYIFTLKRLKSLTNFYTPEFLPDLFSEADDFNYPKFYSKVFKEYNFDIIELNPLSNENADILVKTLEINNFHCEKYYLTTNWTHSDIKSAESYWELRPSQLKNTIRRKKSKLSNFHQYRITISNSDTDIDKLLTDYHKVYKNSWKIDEPYPNFINDICIHEHLNGNLRLGVLYLNDQPVASQIWFTHSKTAYIFKLSYDEKYQSFGVGSILMESMFNHVITEDMIEKVDFLSGDDAYKRDWMSQSRLLYGIRAFNKKTFKGFLCFIFLIIRTKLQALRNIIKN